MGRKLRQGFTTGACAAAASAGAARMLKEQRPVAEVEIPLPAGFVARFTLNGQVFDEHHASCYVIKDAGDDPDVTHGVEVHAEVTLNSPSPTRGEGDQKFPPPLTGGGQGMGETQVIIEGGRGIGKVTKPGLAVPVGEWAINPVPRQMITEAVLKVFPRPASRVPHVTISIPDGEERAKRTLNARLGIVGGLSLLGTTGVVRPISHKAWTDTLEVALDVAVAAGCDTVVLSTGRTSEVAAQDFFRDSWPGTRDRFKEEAFIMMGDHVGYAMEACHRKGVPRVLLAVQFAKLFKIACGHPQTHVGSSMLDLDRLADWARIDGLDGGLTEEIECANTARQVYESLGGDHPLIGIVAGRALDRLRQWAPGSAVAVLLVGYDGAAWRFGDGKPFSAREGTS
jgi:cobalt-precorrin-5B (C1)-methyltransferase